MKTQPTNVWADQLGKGNLVIIYNEVDGIGTLVGAVDKVTPQMVNLMTKIGKGLIYTCITEERARHLQLPSMVDESNCSLPKTFTVSVDHMDTTTGISAFERSHTIKALASELARPEHFRRPGHVFPLISKDKGLLQRVGIAEAAIELCNQATAGSAAYTCEVLNDSGEIATKQEILQIAEIYGMNMIPMSEIVDSTRGRIMDTFSGLVIHGKGMGKKLGFPTANLKLESKEKSVSGVYGVTVCCKEVKYVGVMNIGVRPTFNKNMDRQQQLEMHHEIHLLDFNDNLYGETIQVEVNFFVRNEISFPSVNRLIDQIKSDIKVVEDRFGLVGYLKADRS